MGIRPDDFSDDDDRENYAAATGPLAWRTSLDRDSEAIALITAALARDEDTIIELLGPLSRGQLLILAWTVARWYAKGLEHVLPDAAETLRCAGLDIAKRREEAS
jgi:hypothetical protein